MSTSAPSADGAGKASPPTSRPASPSPSRFRTLARMGTAIRRNSTGLLLNRQAVSRSASKSSLKSEPAQSTPAEATPETVPESPAREAAALEAETSERAAIGSSPLSHEAKATPESTPGPRVSAVLAAEPEPVNVTSAAQPAQTEVAAPSSLPSPAPPAVEQSQNASTSATVHDPAPITVPAVAQDPAPVQPQPDAPPVAQPASQPIAQLVSQAAPISQSAPISQTAPISQIVPASQPAPIVQPSEQPPAQVSAAPAPQAIIVPVVQPIPQPVAQPIQAFVPILAPSESAAAPEGAVAVRFAAPVEEHGADYFAWNNIPITQMKKPSTSSMRQPAQEAPLVGPSEAAPMKDAQSEANTYAADSFAWKDEQLSTSRKPSMNMPKVSSQASFTASPKPMETALPPAPQHVVSPKQSTASLTRPASREQLVMSPSRVPHDLSPKPSRSSIASSYGQVVNVTTSGRGFSVSIDPNAEPVRGRSRSRNSIRVSFDDRYTDPFADPPISNELAIPKTALSPIYSVDTPMVEDFSSMPKPMTDNPASSMPGYHPIAEEPEELHEATPVQMPLPDLSEVVRTNGIRQRASAYSIGESSGIVDHAPQDTDERLPLLRRMPTANTQDGQVPDSFGAGSSNDVQWPSVHRKFESHGWSQHILPDSTAYFFHEEMRVATDVDLRNSKKLETVMLYLTSKPKTGPVLPPPGWEMWLRDAGKGRYDFTPIRGFVSHDERILTFDMPHAGDVSGIPEDDTSGLDGEYRYWAYMESHPAHIVLPQKAPAEAMDALRWCYAECLLPSHKAGPQLFAPQECQELMGLLRSAGEDLTRPSIVHTRIVSRVLLRKVQWRQQHFRPDKPLPGDTSRTGPGHRRGIGRIMLDVIVSILCLGIPYLFMGRSSRRMDEEGGVRSQGPVVMIGASSCIVAAVILSASVTILTLPGLDDISRLAGMVAILFSASSMVSAVIALFKYKADVERSVVYFGGEGLMVVSRRSIVMSLPVVFLAWAIAAFVTSVTFYSFRGVTLTSKVIIRQPFSESTHWAVVGGLGGVAGILLVSILLSGR